jgi:hypothetical protein
MSSGGAVDRLDLARGGRRALGVGVIALAVCAIAAPASPTQFFRAYLAAYLFYLGIALGSMVLLMAYHLTGGSWGLVIRRILEAAMKTLPLLALLFLPIAYGVGYLYVWAQPSLVAASPKLQYQQFYLQPKLFWIRAAVYFALWIVMAFWLSRWSRQEDRTGNPRLAWKSQQLSAFGAVLYGISLHFAAVDWGMSLQPVFHSTIWGPLFATGQLLSALAWALLVLGCLIRRPPLDDVASLQVRNDLGSLLLTLLILWAYMAWFQFMLVWISNMPVDVVWYIPRSSPAWKGVMWAIFLLHFVIPFFLLLMRSVKRNSRAVARIAGLILFMQLAFVYYLVMPQPTAETLADHWMDFLTPLGIGGIWLACFLWQLSRQPLLPLNDYNREAALHLRHLDEEAAAREAVLSYEE